MAQINRSTTHALSIDEIRASLATRLRNRRVELEDAILDRVRRGISHQSERTDAEYVAGLQATVPDVTEYGLLGIELGEDLPIIIPPSALEQARRAARAEVSLDVVLRRYMAGHALMVDFVIQEAEHVELFGQQAALRHVLAGQYWLLDQIIPLIANAYLDEIARSERAPSRQRDDQVRRLLQGGRDASRLGYDVEAWHIGAIAKGSCTQQVVSSLAEVIGCQLLTLDDSLETTWVWFGGRRRFAASVIEHAVSCYSQWPTEMLLAIGEPGRGLHGWRMTHRQATSALRLALIQQTRLTRFTDAALVAPWLKDYAYARAFVNAYLGPFDTCDGPEATYRATLRAYFAAGRNAASAAVRLGVTDRTMRNRLRKIEAVLGPLLNSHQAELEIALRLDELDLSSQNGPPLGSTASENGNLDA